MLSSPLNEGGAVHEREKQVRARHHLDEGLSRSEVARRVGIGRRTLYNWIAGGLLDGRLGRPDGRIRSAAGLGPRSSIPTRKIIEARLAEYPELSAVRLFEEVRAAGYAGGYDQVKRHVREVRPREPVEPPGEVRDAAGASGPGGLRGVPAALGEAACADGRAGVLPGSCGCASTSGRRWAWSSEGSRRSFACFGGVPSELLFDQMKAVGDRGRARLGGPSWWRTRSSGASATTGASGSGRAVRTARRRRGRSSARSGT